MVGDQFMKTANHFLLYLGGLLLVAMVGIGIWSLFVKSKFWTVILILFAILLAVSGVTSLIVAFRDKN